MAPKRAALFLSLAVLSGATAACESESVYEDCANEYRVGTGEERCVPSTFPTENVYARTTFGWVSYGIEHIPNALVRIDGMSATTDDSGLYRFGAAPFRYDISARLDQDVIAFRGAASRFLDLAVERDVPLRAWTARVAVNAPGAPRPGNALAAFFTGDIVGASGSVGQGLVLSSRSFDIVAKVHVVEYPVAVGVAGAVAKGSADVRVQGGGSVSVDVKLDPVEQTQDASFVAALPPGFVADEAEVILDFGTRLSEQLARRAPLGTRIALPVMADAKWTVRLRATKDGAVASSGRVPFAPQEDVALTLFDAPAAVAPAPDAVANGGVLTAQGKGVFEHVLVPVDGGGGGRTIWIVSASTDTTVPDLTALGLPRASGRYTWTVRSYPDFAFVDSLSGIDVRLYRAVSASSPRTIVLP